MGQSGHYTGGLVMLRGLFLLVAFPFTFMIWITKAVMYAAGAVATGGRR